MESPLTLLRQLKAQRALEPSTSDSTKKTKEYLKPAPSTPDNLEDHLRELYAAKVEEISAKYEDGKLDSLRNFNKELHESIKQTEYKLSDVWQQCLKNNATLEGFKEILDKWYELQIKKVGICKSTEKLSSDPDTDFIKANLIIKLHSDLAGKDFYICSTKKLKAECTANDPDTVVYLPHEIRNLSGLKPDELKKLHHARKLFGGEIIFRNKTEDSVFFNEEKQEVKNIGIYNPRLLNNLGS